MEVLDLSGEPGFVDSRSKNQDLTFIRSVGKGYPNFLSLVGFLGSISNPNKYTGGDKLKKELDFFQFCSQGALQSLQRCAVFVPVVPEFITLKS